LSTWGQQPNVFVISLALDERAQKLRNAKLESSMVVGVCEVVVSTVISVVKLDAPSLKLPPADLKKYPFMEQDPGHEQ
jgi:hypothetical protein